MKKRIKNIILSVLSISLVYITPIKLYAQEAYNNKKVTTSINNINKLEKVESNIMQNKSRNNNYIDLDEFELIELNEDVYVWDDYYQAHGIRYDNFGDKDYTKAFIEFIYACSNKYIKSDYIFLEEFKEENGYAVYQQGWYWDFRGKQGGFMTHYFDKNFYNQEYLYFLLGVADSSYVLTYEDWNYFKIKNPFYKQSEKLGWVSENGKWYYYDLMGIKQTGWKYINGEWYYLNENGAMQTGWKYINGEWYYLNENGAMQTGWKYINGEWYYLNESGTMQIGWKYINGEWYYMYNSGKMARNTIIEGWTIDLNGIAKFIK